jgi:hypothetical protein
MIGELAGDNTQLVGYLRATHAACDEHNDAATASLLENWIDEVGGKGMVSVRVDSNVGPTVHLLFDLSLVPDRY